MKPKEVDPETYAILFVLLNGLSSHFFKHYFLKVSFNPVTR